MKLQKASVIHPFVKPLIRLHVNWRLLRDRPFPGTLLALTFTSTFYSHVAFALDTAAAASTSERGRGRYSVGSLSSDILQRER